MLIKSLKLDGVGSFRKPVEIDMEELGNLCLISGKNGSGKSSIHNSIGWLLFGDTPLKDMDSIINDYEDEALGEMYFSQGGVDYWLTRNKVRGGRNTVRMAYKGEDGDWYHIQDHTNKTATASKSISALSARDALPIITSVIKMTPTVFYALVTLPQSSLSSGTTFTGSDSNTRRDFIMSMVREVDEWAVYHSIASENLRSIKSDITSANAALDEIESRLKSSYVSIYSDLQTVCSKTGHELKYDSVGYRTNESDGVIGYKKAIKLIHNLVNQAINEYDEVVNSLNAKIEALNNSQNNLIEGRSELQDELSKLRSMREHRNKEARSRIRTLESELRELNQTTKMLNNALKRKSELEGRVKSANADIEDLVERREELSTELESLNSRHESAKKNEAEVSDSLSRASQKLAEAIEQHKAHEMQRGSNKAKCIVCESELTHEQIDSMLERSEINVDEATEEKSNLEDELDKTSRTVRRLSRSIRSTTSELNSINMDISSKESFVQNSEDEFESIENDIKSYRRDINSLRDEDEIEDDIEKQKSIIEDESEDEIELINKIDDIDSSSSFARDISKYKREVDEAISSSRKLSRLDGNVDNKSETIQELALSYSEKSDEHEELIKNRDVMSYVRDALAPKGIPMKMVTTVLDSIEDKQNEMLFRLMGDKSFTVRFIQEKTLKNGNTTETLDIMVYTKEGVERVFETFSGGERTRIAICNLFATIEVFNERQPGLIETIFLDEPFGVMDEESQPIMVECIMDALKRGVVKQVFITDHNPTVKSMIPHVVNVVKNNDADGSEVRF